MKTPKLNENRKLSNIVQKKGVNLTDDSKE